MLDLLKNFTFHTQWNAGILLMVLLGTVFYLFLLPSSNKHPIWKTIIFISGLFLIFLTVGSPLNLLGRIVFRGHMIQMVILLLIAAPLLLLGFKTEIIKKAMTFPRINSFFKIVVDPRLTIPVFHVLFIGYHVPSLFDFIRVNYFLNYFYLLCLFIAALLLWAPIMINEKELTHISCQQKMKYCVLNLALFIPVSLYLLMSNNILYSLYMDPDLIKSSLEVCLPPGVSVESIPEDFFNDLLPYPPLKEQKIGGYILLIGQSLIFATAIMYLRAKKK
ncbi:cytochrome c oxidase assembly protein [Litchfieldia salsa]|uniref:Putative membrane protein n=1 Tax=Litchfieldia salsa TaxID=930152 RepID=A0A1H0P9K0_9BACI|nr:cytochrome c oxidase assembly protein [Litchfieldia salsa]SDP01368.1 putative membrane protein [Litchfieldia salsa]